jgi:hypothetical protein
VKVRSYRVQNGHQRRTVGANIQLSSCIVRIHSWALAESIAHYSWVREVGVELHLTAREVMGIAEWGTRHYGISRGVCHISL